MAEIPLTASTAASLSTQAAAGVNTTPNLTPIQVGIADLSSTLASLTYTIQTNATPVSLSGDTLTLSTPAGTVSVLLPQLATSAQQNMQQQLLNLIDLQRPLTLSVQAGSPPTQAVLLIPASSQPAPQANQPLSVNPVTSALATSAQSLPLTAGTTIEAIVLPSGDIMPESVPLLTSPNFYAPPAPQAVAAQSAPAVVSSGTTAPAAPALTATPLMPAASAVANAPTETSASPPAPLATGQNAIAQPVATGTTQTPTPALPPPSPAVIALLQPGNEVSVSVNTVLPPTVNPATLPPLAPNQTLATVTGNTPDGKLVLQAGDAALYVKSSASAAVGTTLVVTVEAAKPLPLMPLPTQGGQNLPSLPSMLAALAQANPQVFQQMMNAVPQPTDSLAGTLLMLLSAFKKSDVRGWMGEDPVRTLTNAGKNDLIANLAREVSDASQPARDVTVGEWHSYPIPFFAQEQFQALTLYVHNDKNPSRSREDQDAEGKKGKVRFLIDLRLSKLGAMQLDGFVQPKKLDMLLRSENRLPEGLHHSLRAAYINAISAVGYTGSLNFQVGQQHWLRMQQAPARGIVT